MEEYTICIGNIAKIRAAFLDVRSLDKNLQILKTKTSVNKLKTVFIKGIKIIFSSKMK